MSAINRKPILKSEAIFTAIRDGFVRRHGRLALKLDTIQIAHEASRRSGLFISESEIYNSLENVRTALRSRP